MEDVSKYRGNSDSAEKPKKRKVERIVSIPPIQSKPPLGTRVKALFIGEDARSVGTYLLTDVVVPAAKDLIFDIFTEGASRSLYGDSSRGSVRRSSSPPWKTHTPYNRVNKRTERREERSLDRRDRAVHDFSNLRFANAGEAEAVIDGLERLIAEYGVATVNDFYDSIGLTGEFTDDSYGWDNVRGSSVRRVRDGYLIILPQPKPID